MGQNTGQRIAKLLSRAGVASRREAERAIEEGRVQLDGKTLTTPAVVVEDGQQVLWDGKPLPDAVAPTLYCYHKPRGLVCTHYDPQERPTIYSKLPKPLAQVQSVGRLDINSEGLLLLTNHGGLKRLLELPRYGWERQYRVRAFGRFLPQHSKTLAQGMEVDGVRYAPIRAKQERVQGDNVWLSMRLTEGKNREIKNVMEALGLRVNRLIRTGYGPFTLGKLAVNAINELSRPVLRRHFAQDWVRLLEGEL